MEIILNKKPSLEEENSIRTLAQKCGITFDTARLLFYRKINTVEKAKRFLNPSKNNFISPFEFSCMASVTEKIKNAKENNKKVLIFGDYDADGICATSVLYYCLKEYGISPFVMIPERDEGYGLNVDRITAFQKTNGLDLVITVDCGISDVQKISVLMKNGIDVIVTDHHEPPKNLPNCLIVNPKIEALSYPFNGLCGAGVAFKVGCALIGEKAYNYLDFVALATVADSMNLIEENRDLVYEGLKLFEPKKVRSCFKYLLGDSDKHVTAQTLAYLVAPRINAGGRMGDANSALRLFIEKDENIIFDLSVKLNTYNTERQSECENVYKCIKQSVIDEKLYNNSVICVKGSNWNVGVIGIVAAKLVEDFNKPVIVFAEKDEILKGSARSVEGVNVYNLINAVKNLIIDFGGHSQAAGISLLKENFESFSKAVSLQMDIQYPDYECKQILSAEWYVSNPISLEFAREIDMLEPFGVGNKKPCFIADVKDVFSKPLKTDSPHCCFDTDFIQMLEFNGIKDVFLLSLPIKKSIAFEINYSVFRGKEQVKGFVKKIVPDYGDYSDIALYLFKSRLNQLANPSIEYESIDFNEKLVESGYGVMYAVNDYDNLNNYDIPKVVNVYAFMPNDKAGRNCVVLSPICVPEEYSQVIYLDTPVQAVNSFSKTKCVNICGYDYLDFVYTDREFFASVFNYMCKLEGMKFLNSVWAYYNYSNDFDGFAFVFCAEVFLELGFFEIVNGSLTRNRRIKNELTNSVIYSKICSIKGELC